MNSREIIGAFVFFALLSVLFFYKTFFQGQIPFPGDLLISEYNPWKSYSFLGYNPGTYPSKVQYFDVLRQMYPWKTFSLDLLRRGELPFWNPYNFSGSPLLANFQSAVFYPFNILYLFLSQINAWALLVLLQPILAGFFTYLYTRKIGMSLTGAFFSSIAFSYCLFMSVFLEYTIIGNTVLWLPLSLYSIEIILEKKLFLGVIIFVLSLVFSAFAGHIQIFGFIFIFIFIYLVLRIISKNWSKNKKIAYLGYLLLLMLLSIGIFSVQLLPALELISNSARSNQEYAFLIEKLLLQPQQLIVFLSPDIFGNPAAGNYLLSDSYPGNAVYIGLAPFIFSVFALASFKKGYFIKLFTIFSSFLLLLFVRSPLTEIFYSFKIPFFSTGSPTNAIFLVSFSASILAGFGIGSWLETNKKSFFFVILAIAGIFIALWVLVLFDRPQINIRNFFYSTMVFSIFVAIFLIGVFVKNKKNYLAVLFISITVFDLFYFFQKFNPFAPSQLIFPDTSITTWLSQNAGINRFWGYGNAEIQSNFATQYSLFSPDGYDPLYPRIYGEFIQSSIDGKINTFFSNKTRSDAVIASGYGENDLSANSYRLKVMDVLGVKYILDKKDNASTEKTFPPNRFKQVYNKDEWIVFENVQAAPRAFLTADYDIYKSKEEFEKKFFSKDFNPSKTVLLDVALPEDLNIDKSERELKTIAYEPNLIIFKTNATAKQLLFLSDTYYPGWKAIVDEEETKIYRANYAFRAIVVPAGMHEVRFMYAPSSFNWGLKISIISLVMVFVGGYAMGKVKIYEY